MLSLEDLTFGIEIETVGKTREQAAKAIAELLGGSYCYGGGHYDTWEAVDSQQRVWKVMSDSSLNNVRHALQCEVVSPILHYSDIPMLQSVIRCLRKLRLRVDETCGIHIHIGASPFDVNALTNLIKIVNKQENIITKALAVDEDRKRNYARDVDSELMSKIAAKKPATNDDLNMMWYGYRNINPDHYNGTRYHGLNLHNVWYRGTIEFRWFNSTLHAGKVKSYIQLCMLLALKALNAKMTSAKRRNYDPESAKYDLRVFLLGLGMTGDEYKTARKWLMDKLPGDAATKKARHRKTSRTGSAHNANTIAADDEEGGDDLWGDNELACGEAELIDAINNATISNMRLRNRSRLVNVLNTRYSWLNIQCNESNITIEPGDNCQRPRRGCSGCTHRCDSYIAARAHLDIYGNGDNRSPYIIGVPFTDEEIYANATEFANAINRIDGIPFCLSVIPHMHIAALIPNNNCARAVGDYTPLSCASCQDTCRPYRRVFDAWLQADYERLFSIGRPNIQTNNAQSRASDEIGMIIAADSHRAFRVRLAHAMTSDRSFRPVIIDYDEREGVSFRHGVTNTPCINCSMCQPFINARDMWHTAMVTNQMPERYADFVDNLHTTEAIQHDMIRLCNNINMHEEVIPFNVGLFIYEGLLVANPNDICAEPSDLDCQLCTSQCAAYQEFTQFWTSSEYANHARLATSDELRAARPQPIPQPTPVDVECVDTPIVQGRIVDDVWANHPEAVNIESVTTFSARAAVNSVAYDVAQSTRRTVDAIEAEQQSVSTVLTSVAALPIPVRGTDDECRIITNLISNMRSNTYQRPDNVYALADFMHEPCNRIGCDECQILCISGGSNSRRLLAIMISGREINVISIITDVLYNRFDDICRRHLESMERPGDLRYDRSCIYNDVLRAIMEYERCIRIITMYARQRMDIRRYLQRCNAVSHNEMIERRLETILRGEPCAD